MLAVYRPRSGGTPLEMAKAMASGRATMPTIAPAAASAANWRRLYPFRVVRSLGTNA
jgi:hypothetical protein